MFIQKAQSISRVSLPVVIGGNGVINYTLSSILPAGLLFTDGIIPVITGNPTVSIPTTDYTYIATDSDGDTATLNFSIEVNESPSFVNGDSFVNIPAVENVDIVGTDNFFAVIGDPVPEVVLGGADASFFTLSQTGTLTFKNPPNFERPRDNPFDAVSNTNTYILLITASE